MAKQFIISAMEETLGEYILNISKDNLKIAAIKGQLKIENVQLDGDLVGSHVLGAMGLSSSYGVLSCSAKSIQVSIPWKNLEKEPTKFEIHGVHLICVPLTPSTANQMYGAGTLIDPRCTLRTRAKRLVLARYERNYWNGLLPNEGPVMKRIQRAVKDVERDRKRSSSKTRNSTNKRDKVNNTNASNTSINIDEMEMEEILNNVVHKLSSTGNNNGDTSNNTSIDTSTDFDETSFMSSVNTTTTTATGATISNDEIPELPRDWKVKLREKILRNIEASFSDLHIRLEVPEHGLELTSGGGTDRTSHTTTSPTTSTNTASSSVQPPHRKLAEQRAFTLGFTLESLVIRTANSKWEVGSHEKRNFVDESTIDTEKDHLGPNEYVTFNNKIGYFNKLSMYWDDEPPILLSETDVLQGNYRKYSPDKLQAKVVAAMDALFSNQDPGTTIRHSLSTRAHDDKIGEASKPHFYVCQDLDAEIRCRTSDRVMPGPISCSADVLPFNFAFNFLPSQYLQYLKLKTAVKLQQRFDTMPRQRPFDSPHDNPRAWWKYAILCVTARPNARPWQDVKRICQCRSRYIELVVKKNSDRGSGVGYHAGLNAKQSEELLLLEDSLPIEAMLAFHLVALRRVHGGQSRSNKGNNNHDAPRGTSRFRMLRTSGATMRNKPPSSPSSAALNSDATEVLSTSSHHHTSQSQGVADASTVGSQMSLLDAMTLRLGKKVWFVDWKLRDATMCFLFRRRPVDTPMLQLVLRVNGNLRSFGLGKRDFDFTVSQCDIMHRMEKVLFFSSVSSVFVEEDLNANDSNDVIERNNVTDSRSSVVQIPLTDGVLRGPDLTTPSSHLELPGVGTACRIVAGKDQDTFKLSISAHPATLVWTTSLSDSVSGFFSEKSSDLQKDVSIHIKNFATPMARKAQLALLSPASLSLHLNIAAPKIWIPLISGDAEGSLVLDAGTLRYASSKNEGETEVQWKVQARDIGAKFFRGLSLKRFSSQSFPNFRTFAAIPSGQGQSVVVRPFSIDASSAILRGGELDDTALHADAIRNVDVNVSPICLNLVDAEIIAKLLGKLYARGLHRVRREAPQKDNSGLKLTFQDIKWSELPRVLSFQVEKVEIALEGYSKPLNYTDDRSMASFDTTGTFQENVSRTRAYLVEIFKIAVKKSSLRHTEVTRVSIVNASIVRLRDVAQYSPLAVRREAIVAENCIFQRPFIETETISSSTVIEDKSTPLYESSVRNPRNDLFRASVLHNKLANLDEVEVDVDAVILRVTPTTLKDCSKAFRRIMELGHLVTKEMERKVHEQGRNSRRRSSVRDTDGSQVGSLIAPHIDRPASPAFSEAMTDFTTLELSPSSKGLDSSIHFRVTLNNCTVLVGRPTTSLFNSPVNSGNQSFAVIQIRYNALLMFQSIENPDSTGTKTLHVSVDNVSGLVSTKFEYVDPVQSPLILEPSGGEFRVVYFTENYGCVVSQDISINLDSLKLSLTPNDASIIVSISRSMFDRLRSFGIDEDYHGAEIRRVGALSTLLRYQKKGTGVATRVRLEIHSLSLVILRAYKTYLGAPEFLNFTIKHVKGLFEGCISAFSGEATCDFSITSYSPNILDWDHAVEPCSLIVRMEQMPNDLVLNVEPTTSLQMNLTGTLLKDLAEFIFDLNSNHPAVDTTGVAALEQSILSTVGLRRATVARSVTIINNTGLDFQIVPSYMEFSSESQIFLDKTQQVLDVAVNRGVVDDNFSLSLRLAPSATTIVGERQPVHSLPIGSSGGNTRMYVLRPSAPSFALQPGQAEVLRLLNGRSSPESMLSEVPVLDTAYYNAEPVVECCMQNQRLRPSIVDVFNLQKGQDLLSSIVWSPVDISGDEVFIDEYEQRNQAEYFLNNGPEAAGGINLTRIVNTEEQYMLANPSGLTRGNWLRPYLKNDSPEWSDMTCMLSIARENVLLPDSRWMWLNDWSVDVSGRFNDQTDADGWSYEADFETFSNNKRHYTRGDACRRRMWTRTRIVQPPLFDDPLRPLKFIWESKKDDNGCFIVTVRSHVQFRNSTSTALSFFVFTPSWDSDKYIGTAEAGEELSVPVVFASAVYMRFGIAKQTASVGEPSISDYSLCARFPIVPTSYTSSSLVRTRTHLEDVLGTVLHHSVELRCERGALDIIVMPVFRFVNLLPCQVECQVGHFNGFKKEKHIPGISPRGPKAAPVVKTEEFTIGSGHETTCTAVNPWLKPHISLRVPGYKWSSWKKIVNRKPDNSWRPSESDEEWQLELKGDVDYSDEVKTLVRFERLHKNGDPLVLILSVSCDHCPVIRIFAQFWIVDKSGFGCHFSEGFTDILGNTPDPFTSRRSYLMKEEIKNPGMKSDMLMPGHEWSMGCGGMSLYFSEREKLALAIESGIESEASARGAKSKWISPLDISNVIPKTVFSVDELNGSRRFELAIHVTLCPGKFGRTKMISLLPRYLIVNLLHRELVIAQDGCLGAETVIPSQSSISFHWEKANLPPKVRLGAPSAEERVTGNFERCWTNGRFQLDRVGITSLRLPTTNTLVKLPMVVQAEVRLASKNQASAVVVVVWSGNDKSNPLYTLRNRTRHVILCRQPLQDENHDLIGPDTVVSQIESCTGPQSGSSVFECGGEIGPVVRSFLGLDRVEEFVWVLKPGAVTYFGFDDPEKPHILEWTYVNNKKSQFTKNLKKAFLEVDAMGSYSLLTLPNGAQMRCQIKAEYSTKVIEFIEIGLNGQIIEPMNVVLAKDALHQHGLNFPDSSGPDEYELAKNPETHREDDDDAVAFSLKVHIPVLAISVIDNADVTTHGREILLAHVDKLHCSFSQTMEGYHNYEVRLMSLQVDNHIRKSIHPVMIFCPRLDEREPLFHLSAVRRLQSNNNTFVFRYAAIRLLDVEIYMDRRTTETIARFIQPLLMFQEVVPEVSPDWVSSLTAKMAKAFATPDRRMSRDLENMTVTANSGRIYFEQLHLHPVRIGLTFTQEWLDYHGGSDSVMLFQFIRGMASIANAPLVFTSFVVGHVFESPQALFRVISTHYSSQLTKQVFGILGSLAIFGAPADFISNVGNGVKDFFYEPLQGAVIGPKEFFEGLEVGTQSLARGVFVGVVRGAANVTDAVNSNLAGLTADENFIDERKAHQRRLTDAMSRGVGSRTFQDSLNIAYASVARGLKSGVLGIVEQPAMYASKYGPVGFIKGIGKALVGVVVKPVVGLGDGAVVVMNHMSDMTSKKLLFPKIPKRLRRALPSHSASNPGAVYIRPYDERAAKAQDIVTAAESIDDVYLGHVNIPSHLVIASERSFWAIDRRSQEPWCVNWEEISHYKLLENGIQIIVFSQTGLKTYFFHTENSSLRSKFHRLLSMQHQKMANASELNNTLSGTGNFERISIPGLRAPQVNHIFGTCNNTRKRINTTIINDEVDLVEQCHSRIRKMDSSSTAFFKVLDMEAWSLVSSWGQLFTGLSSRRCIVASIINGTGYPIQIKSTRLVVGGSPCYTLATREYDTEQGILHAGGVIIFFGWGAVPNLLQAGNVCMQIETNGFVSTLVDHKSHTTTATAMPGYQVGFLEKSYDDSGWWAKYWLLVRISPQH